MVFPSHGAGRERGHVTPGRTSIARRRGRRLALAQTGSRETATAGKGLSALLVEAAGTAADAPVVSQRSDVEGLEFAALVGTVGPFEQRVGRLALGGTVVGGVLRHG